VIEDLRRELPRLAKFATLSPIPGFREWLDEALAKGNELLPSADIEKFVKSVGHLEPVRALRDTLARPDWPCEATLAEALREPMEKLCARYLLREKSGTLPLDPVARFHLNNGARLDRIYWLADSSARGMSQSYGMMASYRYVLDANHERFRTGGYAAAARRVLRLLD